MDQRTLGIYLSRILSGFYLFFFHSKKYKLIYPNVSIRYEADIYAQEEYINNKFNDWIYDEDILNTLMMMGVWNPMMETELKDIESKIENLKIDLYKNFLQTNRNKQIKRQLSSTKKRFNYLYNIRHSLDHLTLTGYVALLKNQYILVHSLYDHNNNKLYDNIDDVDFTFFNAIANTIYENVIPADTFRQIARSDSWRSYWSANKDYIFDKAVCDWTDEQRTLVVLTRMYDNAYEHPECPSDNIINDDDAFDGWMILQRKESEKEKNKKRTEKLLGNKLDKAGEVFVVANSPEEAQDIYNLNSNTARFTIKERENIILNSTDIVESSNLPDVQRDLTSQQNQIFKDKFKK